MTISECEKLQFVDDAGKAVALLSIYSPSVPGAVIRISDAEAWDAGEEPLQLLEGLRYDYELDSADLILREEIGAGIVEQSANPHLRHCGLINTGLNVGRFGLIVEGPEGSVKGRAALEIRSRKIQYREHYRWMLEDIAERSTDFLMEFRSPTAFRVAPDPGRDSETLYQRFAFLRSVLGSRQFANALHRITANPHRRWEAEEETRNLARAFRPTASVVRQLARDPQRVPVPAGHPLFKSISSLPRQVVVHHSVHDEDTPENQFVKFAVKTFSAFLGGMSQRLLDFGKKSDLRLVAEIDRLRQQLDVVLGSSFFRFVSDPDLLPLGSPVLQRRAGYREVLQAWLRFGLAARLVWHGGEDVYGAGQRNIAALYEYWVFFQLLEIVARVFDLNSPPAKDLLVQTEDGFGLKLKIGHSLPALYGKTSRFGRPLNMRFSYNRTFSASPNAFHAGSWTRQMRPDYSLSLWPSSFSEAEAERQELMVHVHFDAKYRIENLEQLFGSADLDLTQEKGEQETGYYKRADLLKMHAYRDAIRRSYGAYVLYPGDIKGSWSSYHELLPGLGAFPLRPGGDTAALEEFIRDILRHASNRATAAERKSYHAYTVNREPPATRITRPFPERQPSSSVRHVPPVECIVIIDQVGSDAHASWVASAQRYVIPLDLEHGSAHLDPRLANVQYLKLEPLDPKAEGTIFEIVSSGFAVVSRSQLVSLGCPIVLSADLYLMYEVRALADFPSADLRLPTPSDGSEVKLPYVTTLGEALASGGS